MDIKLSQLPVAVTSTASDFMMIVQNGVNKQITLTTLLNTLNSGNDIKLNPGQNPINITASSANATNLFFLQGTSDSIGINTNTPQALFHVNGNLKVGLSGNTPFALSSMVWSTGGIITVTTTLTNSFVTGQTLLISGVVPSPYNGAFNVTVTGVNTFTYVLPGYPSTSPGTVSTQGSITTISSQGNGVLLNSDEAVFYPSGGSAYIALNAARELSSLVVSSGTSSGLFSLGNGVVGQYKCLAATALPVASTTTVSTKTYSQALGFNTITFSLAGQSVLLRCSSISGVPTWICVGNNGAILTTL
jgi:hypothetical protein